jgi:hypothetical protein
LNAYEHGSTSSPNSKQYASVSSPSRDKNNLKTEIIQNLENRPFTTTHFNALEADQLMKT